MNPVAILNAMPGAVSQGLIWGIMAIGIYITYRILDVSDLTVDGTMCTGGAVFIVATVNGCSIPVALLLLDEHTAALDPKTAAKVLDTTNEIVTRDNLTTVMITHNMKDAIRLGTRLVMMDCGHIIYDVSGEEKQRLEVKDLLRKFEEAALSGPSDRMLLGNA